MTSPALKSVVGLNVPYIGLVSSYHRASAPFQADVRERGYFRGKLEEGKSSHRLGHRRSERTRKSHSRSWQRLLKVNKGGSGRSISDFKGVYTRTPEPPEQKKSMPEQQQVA